MPVVVVFWTTFGDTLNPTPWYTFICMQTFRVRIFASFIPTSAKLAVFCFSFFFLFLFLFEISSSSFVIRYFLVPIAISLFRATAECQKIEWNCYVRSQEKNKNQLQLLILPHCFSVIKSRKLNIDTKHSNFIICAREFVYKIGWRDFERLTRRECMIANNAPNFIDRISDQINARPA